MLTTYNLSLLIKIIVYTFLSLPKIFWLITVIIVFSIILCKQHSVDKKAYINYKSKYNDHDIYYMLDFYYVKNIQLEMIKLIKMISSSIGLLLLLRIINFGKTYDISQFYSQKVINIISIIILFIW